MREDLRRFVNNLSLVDKDELLVMMRHSEAFLLEFETEQRAEGLTPAPRDTDLTFPAPALPPKAAPRAMEDRLGGGRDIKDRLGPKQEYTGELRECNACKKVGHIARNCPTLGRSSLPPTPAPAARASTSGGGSLAAHVTKGATCTSCQKPGHVAAQCWSTHPELLPTELFKKRTIAMSVGYRKRRKAADYISPGYEFQGMAITYRRDVAVMPRRSTRPSNPTQPAKEAAEQRPARRVQLSTP